MKIGYKNIVRILTAVTSMLASIKVFAQTASNIQEVAVSIQAGLTPLINLVVSACYFGGAGFCAAAIFKFKAHKDNPTQVPVGTPIMLLFVGVTLLFLPSIINLMANTMGISGTSSAFSYNSGVL
jgi:intracellular multiplication protein IcmD